MHINVEGGTNAGIKKPLAMARGSDWECVKCHARCKHYWRNCPNCGERRPEDG